MATLTPHQPGFRPLANPPQQAPTAMAAAPDHHHGGFGTPLRLRRRTVKFLHQLHQSGALGELIRYIIVGVIAVGIDLVTTKIVKEILFAQYADHVAERERMLVFIAGVAGCAVGMTAIYLMSLKFVFKHRTVKSKKAEFTVFMLVGVVGVAMQLGLYYALNHLWITYIENLLPQWGVPHGVVAFLDKRYYLFDKLIAIGVVFMFSFVTRRQLLFRRRHRIAAGLAGHEHAAHHAAEHAVKAEGRA